MTVPFHRPDIGEEEIDAVTRVLRSGWLTTGAECQAFEAEFAAFVGARHAVAVNSCTAALHLAVEATGLQPGDLVLVPTMTFVATAEVVSHLGGIPVLVDCQPDTLNIDPKHAAFLLDELAAGRAVSGVERSRPAHAMIPVHYGGQMAEVDAIAQLAGRHRLRVIEDAAHALPAEARGPGGWRSVGTTAEQTCFSFYANKTITTGEGGMLVTDSQDVATRVRRMSLHGLSSDAWERFTARGRWDYRVVASGFKYNLTDLAAALGRVQLQRARVLADGRRRVAERYHALLRDLDELELPVERPDRRSSWHLYPLRLRTDRIDRATFIEELQRLGIGTSVHWRPLHLHPYFRERFRYTSADFPVASAEWRRLISLPIFPSMSEAEQDRVVEAVRDLITRHLPAQAVS